MGAGQSYDKIVMLAVSYLDEDELGVLVTVWQLWGTL